jgi:hypothetical protein
MLPKADSMEATLIELGILPSEARKFVEDHTKEYLGGENRPAPVPESRPEPGRVSRHLDPREAPGSRRVSASGGSERGSEERRQEQRRNAQRLETARRRAGGVAPGLGGGASPPSRVSAQPNSLPRLWTNSDEPPDVDFRMRGETVLHLVMVSLMTGQIVASLRTPVSLSRMAIRSPRLRSRSPSRNPYSVG